MRKKGVNRKGFTMVELLASMVLLSIVMMTAVPTTLGVLDKNKRNTIVNDARKFESQIEYKLLHNNNSIKRPRQPGACIVVTLGYLEMGTDFKKGPNGGEYSEEDSYAVVAFKSHSPESYDYYITLVEKYGDATSSNYYGINTIKYSGEKNNPFPEDTDSIDFDEINLVDDISRKFADGIPDSALLSKRAGTVYEFIENQPISGSSSPKKIGAICTEFNETKDYYDIQRLFENT